MDNSKDYIRRINLAIDYIEHHLSEKLTLDTIASVACFSKFHFHRIFTSFIGESLYNFINRLRVEKIAALLSQEDNRSLTELAFTYGFNDSAVFARAFKKRFSISASKWIRGKKSKIDQAGSGKREYTQNIMENTGGIRAENAAVREFQKIDLAYIRHIGPYAGEGALFYRLYKRLYNWARPLDIVSYPETKQIIIYHDGYEITEQNKLRLSASITIPPDIEVQGDIGKMEIPAGDYLVCRFELGEQDFTRAWGLVYRKYLPESGCYPADRPCFEMYCHDFNQRWSEKVMVDICVPVLKI